MRRGLAWAAAAVVGLTATAVQAQPVLRAQVDQNGDFLLIGNTFGFDCAAGTPAPVVGTVGACGSDLQDSSPDIFWQADAPMTGQAQANTAITPAQARSSAVLTIPPTATVTHAWLYWAGISLAGDATATLDRPGGFSTQLTAAQTVLGGNSAYQSVADITALVQANGSGLYRVSDVTTSTFVNVNDNNIFSGWWLVVFYDDPTEPPRNLALFDGLDIVANGQPQNATLSGFLVPPVFGNAKLGVVAFEGDNAIPGDQFFFDNVQLSDTANPSTNFFNGTRSSLGSAVSVPGDLPQLTGGAQSMGGMDIDIVDITSTLTAGQTSAPITADSTGDVYHLAGFVTSIPTFKPDFTTSTKTVVDLNGGTLLPGDVIEYTVYVENTGNDTSVNTVMTDPLPSEVTYVPGSISITTGANTGPKTDMAGDDQCDFAAGTLTCRLGSGANAANGGQMLVGESTTIVFQVTINQGISGTVSNQAIINAGGLQGSPPENTPTDGNGAGSGQPPTDTVVDECANDSHCMAPTPYCKTVVDPNICVECLLDAHCPGTSPTCDTNTDTCVCIPNGMEVCDGIDNDCNNMVDEGFNVGMTCTAGVGECQMSGMIVCDGMGGAVCDAVPGNPSMEICGDQLDSDCDGDPNNGCADSDGDGIFDDVEIQIGTDPFDADSDDDGVPDGQEPSYDQDSDGDGLINALDPDSDNDGLFDGTEMGLGCNNPDTDLSAGNCVPDADGGATTTDPLNPDTDSGGISDGAEDTNLNGAIDPGEGDPNNPADDSSIIDSDGDGLSDDVEIQIGTNPNDADSDDDGVLDGQEVNPSADSDGDGLINALDPDSDNDGLFDGTEMGFDCSHPDTDASNGNCIPDADAGATTTSPVNPDTDNGGISDGSEDTNLNGAIDAGELDPNDPSDDSSTIDSDGDGLSDDTEIQIGTDPFDADSDDDGVLDGQEPNPTDDTDGDGIINALDPDSDNDGIFDGTEMGFDCSDPDTDVSVGNCVPDADGGATTTSPLDPDTDDGGIPDGEEDANQNGAIDPGEGDPNEPADDSTSSGAGGAGGAGAGGAGAGGGNAGAGGGATSGGFVDDNNIQQAGSCGCSVPGREKHLPSGLLLLLGLAGLGLRRRRR